MSKPKSQFVICCQRLLRYYSVLLLNEAQFGWLAELLEKAGLWQDPSRRRLHFRKVLPGTRLLHLLGSKFFLAGLFKKECRLGHGVMFFGVGRVGYIIFALACTAAAAGMTENMWNMAAMMRIPTEPALEPDAPRPRFHPAHMASQVRSLTPALECMSADCQHAN